MIDKICPVCKKAFTPRRQEQKCCGSVNSSCSSRYKYLRRKNRLNELDYSYSISFTVSDELYSFVQQHPATVQEVMAAETVPNLGLVRQLPQRPRFY